MYTKPEFSPLSSAEVLDLIDRTVFATIIGHSPEGIVASHLPFLIDKDRTDGEMVLVSHLACANAHSDLIEKGCEALVIFNGPHGYISSSWYPENPVRDSAPTWNFAVIHCHGQTRPIETQATARHLLALVDHLEHGRENPWRMRELGPGGMERRLPNILGFELRVDRLEAKFKMGQDERLYDTRAAMAALHANNRPLSEMMAAHNAARSE